MTDQTNPVPAVPPAAVCMLTFPHPPHGQVCEGIVPAKGQVPVWDPIAKRWVFAGGEYAVRPFAELLAHLQELLDAYQITRSPGITPGEAIVIAAERLLDRLQIRSVDDDTVGVTIDGVDLHVRTVDDRTTVMVGAEEVPEGRRVFVEDWSGLAWEQEVTKPPAEVGKSPGQPV